MRQGARQCLNIGLQVMSDHKARSERLNDSLETPHREAVPNEDRGGGRGRFKAVELHRERSQGQCSGAGNRRGKGDGVDRCQK